MLHVENSTRGIVLVDRGRLAATFWSRLRGLIGVRHLPSGDGLLIVPCNSVHCMLMSIPIDVLYLDGQSRVVAIDAKMRPWSVGRIRRDARSVLELPAGETGRTGTSVGDWLQVSY